MFSLDSASKNAHTVTSILCYAHNYRSLKMLATVQMRRVRITILLPRNTCHKRFKNPIYILSSTQSPLQYNNTIAMHLLYSKFSGYQITIKWKKVCKLLTIFCLFDQQQFAKTGACNLNHFEKSIT